MTIFDSLSQLAALLTISAALAFWQGYVASRLWNWFLTPFGVPRIGVAHAVGLLMLAAVVLPQQFPTKEAMDMETAQLAFVTWGMAAIALFVGEIANWWMRRSTNGLSLR